MTISRRALVNLGQIEQYITENKIKISQWDALKRYMVNKKISATNIKWLLKTLPKHWKKVLSFVINYILLIDKGLSLNESDD